MGLFRTIPVDIEAVQFGGMENDEPMLKEMGPALPSWLWKAITKGQVAFDTAGVKVNGVVLKAGDWIIFDKVFIDSMPDEKFIGTFVPARKPLSEMATAPKSISQRKASEVVMTGSPVEISISSLPTDLPQEAPTPEPVSVEVVSPPAAILPSTGLGVPSPDAIPDDVDVIMGRLNNGDTLVSA